MLFETDFYRHCAGLFSSAGILVTQNGVPFLQGQELTNTFQRWKGLFATRWCYLTTVPTYVGGPMAMGFASPSAMTLPDLKTLHARTEQLQGLKYYTPEAHLGAFGLPLSMFKNCSSTRACHQIATAPDRSFPHLQSPPINASDPPTLTLTRSFVQ